MTFILTTYLNDNLDIVVWLHFIIKITLFNFVRCVYWEIEHGMCGWYYTQVVLDSTGTRQDFCGAQPSVLKSGSEGMEPANGQVTTLDSMDCLLLGETGKGRGHTTS